LDKPSNVAKGFVVPYIFFHNLNKHTMIVGFRWWWCPEWVVRENGHLYFSVIGVFPSANVWHSYILLT
jgi:hypothetical protein